MNIEITGQGCQQYPHKSYHEGVSFYTYEVIENGAIVVKTMYKLPQVNAVHVPMSEAVELTSGLPPFIVVDGVKMASDMVFNGQNANVYRANHIYENGNSAGMVHADLMVYTDWFNAFGQQFGY